MFLLSGLAFQISHLLMNHRPALGKVDGCHIENHTNQSIRNKPFCVLSDNPPGSQGMSLRKWNICQAPYVSPSVVLHTCNPSTWEVEAGGPKDPLHPHYSMSLSPPGLHETLTRNNKQKRENKSHPGLGSLKGKCSVLFYQSWLCGGFFSTLLGSHPCGQLKIRV